MSRALGGTENLVLARSKEKDSAAIEPHEILFSRLKGLGQIEVSGSGSGRYGLALERALGIEANSSKDADFMGIELKTKHGPTLQTLFSRIPSRYCSYDNKNSFFDSHATYDAKRDRRSLYTSFCNVPDSFGFSLGVSGHTIVVSCRGVPVMEYDAETIEEALLSKHSQTAFIEVVPSIMGGKETIVIKAVRYCKWPSILRFLNLVEDGQVFLDFTLSEKAGKVKDHGFLWRIRSESIEQLYLQYQSVRGTA